MKRKALLAAGFYMFAVLTACQLKKSPAEAHWKEAAESKDFYTYAAEHAGEIELSQAERTAHSAGSIRQYLYCAHWNTAADRAAALGKAKNCISLIIQKAAHMQNSF